MTEQMEINEQEVERFLTLLRRIPDETIQSMATREFVMAEPHTCVVGWALRDDLRRLGASEDDIAYAYHAPMYAEARFGGTWEEWHALFVGVCTTRYPAIETAFTLRVLETV